MAYSECNELTAQYTCDNKQCGTHKEPWTKEAVLVRKKGSLNVVYVCRVCFNVMI